jgi:hypothetical protein
MSICKQEPTFDQPPHHAWCAKERNINMLSTIGIAFIAIVALVIGLFSGGAVNLRRVNAGAAIIGPGIGLVAALTLATIPGASSSATRANRKSPSERQGDDRPGHHPHPHKQTSVPGRLQAEAMQLNPHLASKRKSPPC